MRFIKRKFSLIFFFLLFTCGLVKAQNDNTATFFSRLYFPFDFGYAITRSDFLERGSLIKTGLEYRANSKSGFFVRFNFDNRSNRFHIAENTTTNVVDGKLNFNDYVIGVGYRIGKRKLRIFGLTQTGIATYDFPHINGLVNNFKIEAIQSSTLINKFTFGLEYYIASKAAFSFESSYLLQSSPSVFWINSHSAVMLSIGLSTTLF